MKRGPVQIRLKFGKQAYCVIEVRPGEDSAEAPNKRLRAQRYQWGRRPQYGPYITTGGGAARY